MRLSTEWREEGRKEGLCSILLKILTGADTSIRERYESAVKSAKTLAEVELLENKILKDVGLTV